MNTQRRTSLTIPQKFALGTAGLFASAAFITLSSSSAMAQEDPNILTETTGTLTETVSSVTGDLTETVDGVVAEVPVVRHIVPENTTNSITSTVVDDVVSPTVAEVTKAPVVDDVARIPVVEKTLQPVHDKVVQPVAETTTTVVHETTEVVNETVDKTVAPVVDALPSVPTPAPAPEPIPAPEPVTQPEPVLEQEEPANVPETVNSEPVAVVAEAAVEVPVVASIENNGPDSSFEQSVEPEVSRDSIAPSNASYVVQPTEVSAPQPAPVTQYTFLIEGAFIPAPSPNSSTSSTTGSNGAPVSILGSIADNIYLVQPLALGVSDADMWIMPPSPDAQPGTSPD